MLQHAVCNLPSPMSAPRGRPTLWPGGAGQCGRAGHGLCYQVPASSLSSSRCFFQTSGEPSGCSRHIPRRGLFASKRSIWRWQITLLQNVARRRPATLCDGSWRSVAACGRLVTHSPRWNTFSLETISLMLICFSQWSMIREGVKKSKWKFNMDKTK